MGSYGTVSGVDVFCVWNGVFTYSVEHVKSKVKYVLSRRKSKRCVRRIHDSADKIYNTNGSISWVDDSIPLLAVSFHIMSFIMMTEVRGSIMNI